MDGSIAAFSMRNVKFTENGYLTGAVTWGSLKKVIIDS